MIGHGEGAGRRAAVSGAPGELPGAAGRRGQGAEDPALRDQAGAGVADGAPGRGGVRQAQGVRRQRGQQPQGVPVG